jgi:hypothetical protein
MLLLYGRTTSYVWGDNDNGEFGQCSPAHSNVPVVGPSFAAAVEVAGENTVWRATDSNGLITSWGGPRYVGYSPPLPYTTNSGGSCRPTVLETCKGAPTQPITCLRTTQQNPDATYVAANHVGNNAGNQPTPTDIGEYGATTTIDAMQFGYGGRIVFDGQYRVRGTVRFINGTFELRPGTIFYVDGRSGQRDTDVLLADYYGRQYQESTFIQIENATMTLKGAQLEAACERAWGGIRLLTKGRIRTEADRPSGQRCALRDAFLGIDCGGYSTSSGSTFNGEYYLNETDFQNNLLSIYDLYKGVALANEGVHYCSFSTTYPNVKSPLNDPTMNGYFWGIHFWGWMMPTPTRMLTIRRPVSTIIPFTT